MNNSKLTLDYPTLEESQRDIKPILRQKEGEVMKIVDALLGVAESEDWKVLKKLIFDGAASILERRISDEAKARDIQAPNLYRLQGELLWARKYADLEKLAQAFKVELENIRKKLNAKDN